MAKWHYDITGAEPILRDVPIQAAASINEGEMLRVNTMGSATQAQFVTCGGAGSSAGVDALGVCNETITVTSKADYGDRISTPATTTTDAISSIANTIATGNRYGKAIINPFAVYLFEYDQSAASRCTAPVNAGTTTYTQTVEQYMDGGWLYLCDGSTAAVDGQLRYISVSTGTTSYTLLTAQTCSAADSIISLYPINHQIVAVSAGAAATKLSRLTSMAAGATVAYLIMENYVDSKYKPMQPLRMPLHDGLNDANLRFYADVLQVNHVYNQSA